MTTPTSFVLSENISVCDTLTFANGMNAASLGATQTTQNLLGLPIRDYVLPQGTAGYLLGSYEQITNVFTVGVGNQTLFWTGTSEEFASVWQNGGKWQLAT